MKATDFTHLKVWQMAHQATLAVYSLTARFPSDEKYGLRSQMRRAAISVSANIAEGFGRRMPKDKVRFYTISASSAVELRYYLLLSKDLGFLAEPGPLWSDLESIGRMLNRLSEVILSSS